VEAVIRCIALKPHCIYHLAGSDSLARTELLGLLLESLNNDGGPTVDVEPCGINDFKLPEPRPLDVSLDSSRLSSRLDMRWIPMRVVAERSVINYLSHQ
jgi:dTDP-4-dehydrorhamnose reductase